MKRHARIVDVFYMTETKSHPGVSKNGVKERIEEYDVIAVDDRRKRDRLSGATNGWVFAGDDDHSAGYQIVINDLSRFGVGFQSSIQLVAQSVCKLRVGFGPRRLARRFKVCWCRANEDGTFQCGGEFA
jgi:hypothetical protein